MSTVRGECRCSSTGRTIACPPPKRLSFASQRSRFDRAPVKYRASLDDRNVYPALQPDVPEGVDDVVAYQKGMQEYKDLKDLLLDRTRQSGAAIALYLFFTANGEAALCALLGASFSYVYMLWLFYDVDNLKPGDRIPSVEADKVDPSMRGMAKFGAAYQQALTPRLLVPVAMAVGTAAVGAKLGPVDLIYDGCVMAGFLSYKIALVMKVFDDLSAKSEAAPAVKPGVVPVDDELDMYGRPKAKMVMPTDALPESEREKIIEAGESLPFTSSAADSKQT